MPSLTPLTLGNPQCRYAVKCDPKPRLMRDNVRSAPDGVQELPPEHVETTCSSPSPPPPPTMDSFGSARSEELELAPDTALNFSSPSLYVNLNTQAEGPPFETTRCSQEPKNTTIHIGKPIIEYSSIGKCPFQHLSSEKYKKLDDEDTYYTKPSVPDSLKPFVVGLEFPADPFNKADFDPPPWLNMKKFKLGQSFAMSYFFGLAFAEMLSLMILFSFKGGLDPLIFTDKSSTPYTSFRRYLSTVVRVRSWYEADVWDSESVAGKNMRKVRNLHRNVKERMNQGPQEEVLARTQIPTDRTRCLLLPELHADFRDSVAAPGIGQCPYVSNEKALVHVNQLDMAVTQFGFVGLMVMYPNKFGAAGATKEELDAFVHMWAGLGYLLGIEDRFNFCLGGLDICRQRCNDLVESWVKPNFREVKPIWEHMSRCMVTGIGYFVPGTNFESALCYLCWTLDIPMPRLTAAVSWWRLAFFKLQRFVMCHLIRLPGSRQFHNWLIDLSIKRAENGSPAWLERLKSRSDAFHRQATGSPVTHMPLAG